MYSDRRVANVISTSVNALHAGVNDGFSKDLIYQKFSINHHLKHNLFYFTWKTKLMSQKNIRSVCIV